jgi:hypothetical protein
LNPDLEKPPALGLECEPEAGLPAPKLGFGFQPEPDFLSVREVEPGYDFALVGR